jgi:poly(3-hydroxybutyrate) depolymerase
MLGRIFAVALTIGGAMTSNAALAQNNNAIAGGVVTGLVVGGLLAAGAVQPLREHVYREPRQSYVYEGDVAVGQDLRDGPYESYDVPHQYTGPGYRYTHLNNRGVVYHQQSRRVIHVYD